MITMISDFIGFVTNPQFVIDCCTFENDSIANNSIELVFFYMDLLESI